MSEDLDQIGQKFRFVENQIKAALDAAHRAGEAVKLVVVTKGQSVEKMQALIDAGGRYLGENYPEETVEKIESLNGIEHVEWHMIGHIQSRKIRFLTRYFSVIQSVESIETAKKINLRFTDAGRKVKILLEVNVSGEASKQGFALAEKQNWQGFVADVNEIENLTALEIAGLMTMPPLGDNAESSRVYFQRCKELLEYVNAHKRGNLLTELSMGTSFDYKVAVEEGATIVRVGEAIMGARNYS